VNRTFWAVAASLTDIIFEMSAAVKKKQRFKYASRFKPFRLKRLLQGTFRGPVHAA
jgi:hypothetical protein